MEEENKTNVMKNETSLSKIDDLKGSLKQTDIAARMREVGAILKNTRGLGEYVGMGSALGNIEGISSTVWQMSEAMRKATESSTSSIVSAMTELSTTLGQMSDSVRKAMELNTISINNALKNIAALNATVGIGVGSALSNIEGISSTVWQMSEAMRKAMNFSISSVGVSNAFQNTIRLNQVLANLSIPSNELRKKLMSIDFNSIQINSDGTVNYLDETIDVGQASSEIDEIASQDISLHDKLEKFKKKHFVVYLIFCVMFNFFIIQPLYSYGGDVVKEKAKSISLRFARNSNLKSNNAAKKEIKKEVKKELDEKLNNKSVNKEIYNDYRFVSINVLNVRRNDTRKSPVIYQLHIGQVIKVVNKNKNWTLIEYANDEDTIYIKGWINTRYISRFDK